MKSILEQLQAAKGAAEEAAEKMVKARLEYNDFEENNPYPAEASVEERIAYCDKREALQKAAESTERKARNKVIAYGKLLGMEVTFGMVCYDNKIRCMISNLNYYYDEMRHRLTRMIEQFKDFNH